MFFPLLIDMESTECSFCHQKFDDTTLLLLHQQYEQCYESNSSLSEHLSICPLCNQVFYDPLILQVHVNEDHNQNSASGMTTSDSLYAQDLVRRERMKIQYEQSRISVVSFKQLQEDEDARIARMLHEEENAQLFEEFQVNKLEIISLFFFRKQLKKKKKKKKRKKKKK